MAKLVLKNFLRGVDRLDVLNNLGTNVFGTSENRLTDEEFISGIYSALINPYRILNVLTPAPQKTNVTNMSSVVNTIKNIVVRNIAGGTADAWAVGSNGTAAKLYQITNTGTKFDSVTAGAYSGTTFPRTIASAKNAYDCRVVNMNGTQYLIYTHDDGATTNPARYVGIYNFSDTFTTANAASDTWGTLSTGADEQASALPIAIGADKNWYIGSGYRIDKVNPAVASSAAFSTNAFSIPREYVITSIQDYRGFLVIAAHTKQGLGANYNLGQCAYFFWDYVKSTPEEVVYVDDIKTGALYGKDGVLYTWTGEKDGYSKLRHYDGTKFTFLAAFDRGVPAHGNPDTYRNMLIWGAGTNGRVWSYGSPAEGLPVSLQTLDEGATGCVKVLNTVAGYHYHIAGASTLTTADTGYLGGAVWQTLMIRLPQRATVDKFTFYFLPLASGATATVQYQANHSATPVNITDNAGNATIAFSTDGAVVRKEFPMSIVNTDAITLKVTWPDNTTNTVAITRIEIDYTPE